MKSCFHIVFILIYKITQQCNCKSLATLSKVNLIVCTSSISNALTSIRLIDWCFIFFSLDCFNDTHLVVWFVTSFTNVGEIIKNSSPVCDFSHLFPTHNLCFSSTLDKRSVANKSECAFSYQSHSIIRFCNYTTANDASH